jgi:hypothetical protein
VTLFLDDLSRAIMGWSISPVLDAERGHGDSMRVRVHTHEIPTATGAPRQVIVFAQLREAAKQARATAEAHARPLGL